MTGAVFIALAAVVGAVIGSFLNVCIYRLPLGKSIVWPASACETCGRELLWYENLPIVSWVALGARCRTCKAPLSIRHPIVEAITAVMFGLAAWHYGPTVLLASRLVFGCALAGCLILGFTAIRRRDIPAHRAWMIRAYAVALAAGTQAFTQGIGGALLGAGEPYGDLAQGAGWVINLAVAEWVIRRPARPGRRSRHRHTTRRTGPRATAAATLS